MSPNNGSKTIKIQLSKGKSKHKHSSLTSKSKSQRQVEVIKCPQGMPEGFDKKEKRAAATGKSSYSYSSRKKSKNNEIDFLEASREIHELGSTQFTGYQLKLHKEADYKEITGRTKKREKVPLNILRGMKEKTAQKQKKIEDEAKEAGIIMATKKKDKKKTFSEKNRRDTNLFGPSPSIGFMKKGIYKYKKSS